MEMWGVARRRRLRSGMAPTRDFKPRYLFRDEEAKVRASERAKVGRELEVMTKRLEKALDTNKKFKAVSRAAHAAHSEELSAAKLAAKIAIEREAKLAVKAESLEAEIKTVKELSKSVVDALAALVREYGDVRVACELCSIPYTRFERWYSQGQVDESDEIYRYLVDKIGLARGLAKKDVFDAIERLSHDVMEPVVCGGEVVGERVGRKADGRIVAFKAERVFPETFGAKLPSPLPDAPAHEEDLSVYSDEEFDKLNAAKKEVERIKKIGVTKRMVALQSAGKRNMIDVSVADEIESELASKEPT